MPKHTTVSKPSKREKLSPSASARSKQNSAVVPKKPFRKLRAVVGIGASAGGLEAMSLLLKHLPEDTGMAFVYIQHLDPTHESMLTPLLSRVSPIPVCEAKQGIQLKADTLYVMPPNKSVRILRGTLQLAVRNKKDSSLAFIDNFFRSLALDQKDRSIGVILSGNASDGTLGLKAIKEAKGITFAQTEASAKYPSMPHHAISLGDVDHVLTPAGIAKELDKVARNAHIVHVKAREDASLFDHNDEQESFAQILAFLNAENGVNFHQYKPMTLKRRIARRMALRKILTLPEYVEYLKKNPKEIGELFQDMLINVTEFFRDAEVFEYLKKKIFPQLIKGRTRDESVRIWVAGCSTGEEVYSFAMVFVEFLDKHKLNVPVQIFGTDLSGSCVEKARRAIYPPSSTKNISAERLRRFFVKVDENYQISKIIRDMCVFAKQNVVSDPPFSNMDLVSCRNVLIYLDQSAQKRIIPMFHFTLRPSGFLILGKSEGIGEFSDFFAVNEKTFKIFLKKPLSRLPHFERYVIPKSKPESSSYPVIQKDTSGIHRMTPHQVSNEIDQALLSSSVIPACVVVDSNMEILQFRGDLLPYLEFPKGKATLNLLKIAKEDLMIELRSAVTKAKKENQSVFMGDVYAEGGKSVVAIEVIPLKPSVSKEQHLLVIFHQQKVAEKDGEDGSKTERKGRSEEKRLSVEKERLQKQLEIVKEQLRSVIEEHEATNEEFQSANEEILSSNEELQSFNEEIETTKEELQSTNEELITVNDELQMRNAELAVTNSDLLNVLSSSNVPIIIVDKQLMIRRVTPVTKKSFRIIASDVGRSIGDIKLPIKFPDLHKMILEVIDTMESKNEEVLDEQGDWYTLWVRPYRTLDDKIDGAIITLMDINEIKLAQIAQQGNLSYIEGILGTMREPLVVLDKQFRVMNANNAFYVKFRISRKETEGISFYELGNKEWDTPQLRELLEKVLPQKNFLEDIEIECNFPRIGSSMVMNINAHRLIHKDPNKDSILLVMEDITERKFVQDRTDTFMSMASHELKTPATTIKMLVQILQKRFGKDEDKTFVEYLEKISEQVNSLTKISNDLLDVSGIRAGKFVLHEELFVLCPLVREVVDNCQLLTDTHTIILEGEKTTMLKGDRERIGRVFINLIVNAIKYSPKADKVIVRISHTKEYLTVSVQDFGIGIAVENQKKIFDHSTQVTREKGQHSSGLGLGLYISSTIVKRHGGRIWVESTEGEGSTFFFTLPIPVIDPTDEIKSNSKTS